MPGRILSILGEVNLLLEGLEPPIVWKVLFKKRIYIVGSI